MREKFAKNADHSIRRKFFIDASARPNAASPRAPFRNHKAAVFETCRSPFAPIENRVCKGKQALRAAGRFEPTGFSVSLISL
jgi:hypothetical protein